MREIAERKINYAHTIVPMIIAIVNLIIFIGGIVTVCVTQLVNFWNLVGMVLYLYWIAFVTLILSAIIFYKSIELIIRICKEMKNDNPNNNRMSKKFVVANSVIIFLTLIPFASDIAYLIYMTV